ncbi:MAG: c-type cytochrome domain-containing protein, partial [Verrucomicrobiota bacterium]
MIPPLYRLPALCAAAGRGRAGWVALAFLMVTLGLPGAQETASAKIPARPVFERDIRPILKAHCFHCHGEEEKPKGGIDLRLRRLMLRNADPKADPAIVPGRPAQSRLLEVVRSGEMPKGGKPLSPQQVAILERWIAQGAPTLRPEPDEVPRWVITEEERAFWAFQPVG